MTIVCLRSLALEAGDTAVTPKGTMLVLGVEDDTLSVVWLETQQRAEIWVEDHVYGPVEVLRRRP